MNWTAITIDHLKSAGHGAVVDRAQTTAAGGIDPAAQEIANATARVRSAVKAGNVLDADPAKVPNSLLGLTVRLAVFFLMERIRFSLTEDQKETKKNDNSYLLRITDKRERFEVADDPATDGGEMQQRPPGFLARKTAFSCARTPCRGRTVSKPAPAPTTPATAQISRNERHRPHPRRRRPHGAPEGPCGGEGNYEGRFTNYESTGDAAGVRKS